MKAYFLEGPPIFRDVKAEEEDRKAEQVALRAAAENGLWALADHLMPSDVREAAERWRLDSIMTEMWRSAFIAGYREAHKRLG